MCAQPEIDPLIAVNPLSVFTLYGICPVKVLLYGFNDTDPPAKLHHGVSIPGSSQAVNWVFFHSRGSKNLLIVSEVQSNVFANLENRRKVGLKAGCGGRSQHTKAPHSTSALDCDLAEVKIRGSSWSKFFLETYDGIWIFIMK